MTGLVFVAETVAHCGWSRLGRGRAETKAFPAEDMLRLALCAAVLNLAGMALVHMPFSRVPLMSSGS